MRYTEDNLVQQTTADHFQEILGWYSVYAYNNEDYGPNSLLGRATDKEVVLTRDLRAALKRLNPGLPDTAYDDAVRQVVEQSTSQTLLETNRQKYNQIRDGVRVTFRNARGEPEQQTLKLIDFNDRTGPNNRFLIVRELWVRGDLYRRRMDLIGFVNGLPILFIECKNIHKSLKKAFDQNLSDYKTTVPHIFHHNAIVLLANGDNAKIGSISSKFEHFHEWKRLAEGDPGAVDMETLLNGVCSKKNLLDILENFIVFDESLTNLAKIVAKNHQFLGVNKAVDAVENRNERKGKLGVFWHTQGSGKSYSMVFFTRKVHRKLGGNFTFLVCTDRDDLDRQIYKTFAGCGVVNNDKDPCRASSGEHLKSLLGMQKSHIFTLIQKFNQDVEPGNPWITRDDIIVISDEAHRSQYGRLSLNLRNALPKASCIGFTGTPLFKDDEITRRYFGDYISTYDFQRAVDDGATVPLYYDSRGEKLRIDTTRLNEKIATIIERAEIEDIDVQQKLESELKQDYHIITAEPRLKRIAEDFAWHYSTSWETGKAMIICIDKLTCVRLHQLIQTAWAERITARESQIRKATDDQEEATLRRQVAWMKTTLSAVVISEEQGEVARFEKQGIDIQPYRKRIKDGFDLPSGDRIDIETAFKREEHPFRIAIVCAMWLTGFDVPCLTNLYLDKPLQAHTLMQAIARANRVNEGKNNGLIIDYCNILKNLRRALLTFASSSDQARGPSADQTDPARPTAELLGSLAQTILMARNFLLQNGASLEDVLTKTGFARNAAIARAKEAANQNDETRKNFEIICREVFRKFQACLTFPEVNSYTKDHDAINVIYKMLQGDKDVADISDILQKIHELVDQAITIAEPAPDVSNLYDISRIDFDRLRTAFEKSSVKNTTVQNLKTVIEKRLARLLAENPLRTDYQTHYEDIIAAYNAEKDRTTIETTFEALINFMSDLDTEETRAVREGLTSETLAIFDLLKKADLTPADTQKIKEVAVQLLDALKAEKLKIDQWRDKETTRDAVFTSINDFLYDEQRGLPAPAYTIDDVIASTTKVFNHILYAYPKLPSPIYATA